MTKEQIKKASEILNEIEEMQDYKSKMSDRSNGKVAHFEMHQHYGEDKYPIRFHQRHNNRFIVVVEEIIQQLETELSEIR